MRTKAELLQILVEDTHALWAKSFVDEINEAFGVHLDCTNYNAGGGPKGLTTNDGSPSAIGLACFHLAPMLCDALEVEYETMMGRGFRVRTCVNALRKAGKDQ